MQNKQVGKGAEKKVFCALFLYEIQDGDRDQNGDPKKLICVNRQIDTADRKALRSELRSSELSLFVIGYPGLQEAAKMATDNKEALLETIPGWMRGDVIETDRRLQQSFAESFSDRSGAETALAADAQRRAKEPVAIVLPLGEKGIFAGLWELGEALCCGIDGQLLQIPMKQSVIEICNIERINPYEIPSAGCGLLVTKYVRRMEEYLAKKDLPAAVIGRITDGADRVLRMEDQVRYLDAR